MLYFLAQSLRARLVKELPGEWAYVLAHCLLHLGMGHIREDKEKDLLWNTACDCVAARYLSDLHIGMVPEELSAPLLIITDCECDRLNLFGRDHAFLVPRGKSLPFPAKGPVFYLE